MPKSRKLENSREGSIRDMLWILEMDTLLLDALLEEMHKGNRPDDTFTSFVYACVVKTIKEAIASFFQKHHIKNRLKTLKDHFNECYDLFHKWSGIGWNHVTNMFEAKQEVWNEICKDKPEVQKWKRTLIYNYDKLLELFERDRATGACAENSKDKARWFEKEGIDLNDGYDLMSDFDVNCAFEAATVAGVIEDYTPEYPTSNPSEDNATSNQSCGTSSSKGLKWKASMTDIIETRYDKVNMGIDNLTNVMREVAEWHIRIAEKSLNILQSSRPRHYTKEEVWNELEAIGVKQEARLKCYQFLCENEKAKRQFFGVPRHVLIDMLYQFMSNARLH